MSGPYSLHPLQFLAVAFAAALCATPAQAQTASPNRLIGGYVTFGGGISRPDSTRMLIRDREIIDVSTYEIRTDYSLKNRALVDVGGGVVIASQVTIGAAFTRQTGRERTTVSMMMDEPYYLPEPLSATMESEPLEWSERALHIQFGYLHERGRLRLMGFGGPSHLTVDGELVSNFVEHLEGTWPDDLRLVIDRCLHNDVSRGAWGFNVGGDASVFFSRFIGVGAMVRYSRARIMLPNYPASLLRPEDVDERVTIGNLHAVGGVRFRF